MDFNAQDAPLCESTRDRNFMKSLKEFIKSEKEQLCCPDEGPDEQRYTIYSTAFHKVHLNTSISILNIEYYQIF